MFLTPDVLDEWLSPLELDEKAQQYTLDMLERVSEAEAAHMVTYTVDKRVSNQRTLDPYDPSLLDRV